MCVSSVTTDPHPITTNVGIGQCAAHSRRRRRDLTLLPANLAAAVEGGDDPAASFDLLFATGRGDYAPREDMQMVLLEFVADPLGRATALRHLREEF
ncbi:dfdbf507-b048-47ad-8e5c-58afdca3011f [Thermothielavioides terrestris]|uniref:Dfdbf507-b048-47ad-8e5c-58afdca3011f n=1 Tax=Thermothielavioides terrestris TaxID=2587410 RepID=A0A3S4AUJ1_9PEZI|nr:dfdbf507-b048-47ad-8e5c-58afdca3011f [Thermothielavioides terrestris]